MAKGPPFLLEGPKVFTMVMFYCVTSRVLHVLHNKSTSTMLFSVSQGNPLVSSCVSSFASRKS